MASGTCACNSNRSRNCCDSCSVCVDCCSWWWLSLNAKKLGGNSCGDFTFLLCLEICFMFVPRSHGVGASLGARIEHGMFWGQLILWDIGTWSHGYQKNPKKIVLVVGDSFTEGHGIRHADLRYSNLLGEKLGAAFQVYNLDRVGADTPEEYVNLTAYPLEPDYLVLQYFGMILRVYVVRSMSSWGCSYLQ